MAEGDALRRLKHRYDDQAAFRAMEWAVKLPVIRTAKGHVDHVLHRVAVVLALHADGRTGENAFPSQKTIAQFCGADSLSTVADALERGEDLGLWASEEDASPWGTVQWHLAIDDDGLLLRLEKAENERLERKRSQRAAKNRRQYENRVGIQPQSTGSESFSPSGLGIQPRTTGYSAPVDGGFSPSGPGIQPRPALDNQPTTPATLDQPSSTSPREQRTPPAALGGGVGRDRACGARESGRVWVRGLVNAVAAGLVPDDELEDFAGLKVQPCGNKAHAYEARVVRTARGSR
ncbi:hypothetical protein [Amycolatopsis sp. VC5-11]|uniref:hypothetical protein n=1 Tax=Amycolatopsis sp. VC5-11 TaxID=3120156 RepID=UPI003009FF9F